jgi:hypothetical protein
MLLRLNRVVMIMSPDFVGVFVLFGVRERRRTRRAAGAVEGRFAVGKWPEVICE